MFMYGKQILLANSGLEDINHGVYVERLSEHSVWSASDAFHVVWKGSPCLIIALCPRDVLLLLKTDDRSLTPHQVGPLD